MSHFFKKREKFYTPKYSQKFSDVEEIWNENFTEYINPVPLLQIPPIFYARVETLLYTSGHARTTTRQRTDRARRAYWARKSASGSALAPSFRRAEPPNDAERDGLSVSVRLYGNKTYGHTTDETGSLFHPTSARASSPPPSAVSRPPLSRSSRSSAGRIQLCRPLVLSLSSVCDRDFRPPSTGRDWRRGGCVRGCSFAARDCAPFFEASSLDSLPCDADREGLRRVASSLRPQLIPSPPPSFFFPPTGIWVWFRKRHSSPRASVLRFLREVN